MKHLFLFISFFLGGGAFSAQIVSEIPHVACEEVKLYKELKVYKDPSLFLPELSHIYADPEHGWEDLLRENPLLTAVKGTIRIMRLGPEREFKNFGAIAKLYELSEPKLRKKLRGKNKSQLIIPVKICGGDAYVDSMGFVLAEELKSAQVEVYEPGVLPPSTLGNPIPNLRRNIYWE